MQRRKDNALMVPRNHSPWRRVADMRQRAPILIGFMVLVGVLSVLSPYFLTVSNWLTLVTQTSMMAIVALGETLIILTGGIDLSSGPVVGLVGMLSAELMVQDHLPVALVLVLSIAIGALVGFINGVSVTRLRMAPFIVTLATGAMASGLTLAVSGGGTISPLPAAYAFWGGGQIGPIPVPLIILAVLFVGFSYVMTRTVWGRSVYVVGGNAKAAYLSGISVKNVTLQVYLWAGILYAVAGVIEAGLLDAATASAGTTLVLTPIAAVVIGGVSLFGGLGSLWGTLLGALTLGVLTNGLDLLNVSPYYSQVIYGAVVFLAVVLDSLNRRKRQKL